MYGLEMRLKLNILDYFPHTTLSNSSIALYTNLSGLQNYQRIYKVDLNRANLQATPQGEFIATVTGIDEIIDGSVITSTSIPSNTYTTQNDLIIHDIEQGEPITGGYITSLDENGDSMSFRNFTLVNDSSVSYRVMVLKFFNRLFKDGVPGNEAAQEGFF